MRIEDYGEEILVCTQCTVALFILFFLFFIGSLNSGQNSLRPFLGMILTGLPIIIFLSVAKSRQSKNDRLRENEVQRMRERLLGPLKKPKSTGVAEKQLFEKSELERKYPLAYSAMGGRGAEARRALDRGVNLFNQGQYEAAVESFEKARKRTPSDETVWAALVPPLLLKSDCHKSGKAVEKAKQIDDVALGAQLAAALFTYHCETKDGDKLPVELVSKKRDIPVPPVLEVPVNRELIRVEFGMVPKSARQWWGEGIRMMTRGQVEIARTMFQAAIIEYPQFSHAWAGLASAMAALGQGDKASAAQKCSQKTRKNKMLDEKIMIDAGLHPRDLWIYAITLYRIVYEHNLRPLL